MLTCTKGALNHRNVEVFAKTRATNCCCMCFENIHPCSPMLMPDYVIKSNSQAAQENSQQDVVNALVMLQKAVHSMRGLSLNYHD